MLEIMISLLIFSLLLCNIVLLDFNFNDGKFFFVESPKDLQTALFLSVIPIINIFVLIIVIQKHYKGVKDVSDE